MARGLRVLNGSKAVAIGPSAFFDSFTVLSTSIHVKQPRQLLHHRPAQLLGVHDRPRAAVVARHVMPDADRAEFDRRLGFRSEEHTYELQSIMRISYAVFCLKKKRQHKKKRLPT